jgi:hypothetical protein
VGSVSVGVKFPISRNTVLNFLAPQREQASQSTEFFVTASCSRVRIDNKHPREIPKMERL